MPSEARCFTPIKSSITELIQVDETISLIISGMGKDRALEAGKRLIENGATHLISWGTAAALNESLKPGDVLLPEYLIDQQGNELALHPLPFLQKPDSLQSFYQKGFRISRKNLATTGKFLDGPEMKKQLHQASGALAADMETAAIFRAASQNEIPVSAIRAISDSVHHSVPTWLETSLDEYGQPKNPEFLFNLLRSPMDLISLCRLGLGFQKACHSLKALSSLIKQAK